jgi:hypothetical protein
LTQEEKRSGAAIRNGRPELACLPIQRSGGKFCVFVPQSTQ